jgi:hypothetical protein
MGLLINNAMKMNTVGVMQQEYSGFKANIWRWRQYKKLMNSSFSVDLSMVISRSLDKKSFSLWLKKETVKEQNIKHRSLPSHTCGMNSRPVEIAVCVMQKNRCLPDNELHYARNRQQTTSSLLLFSDTWCDCKINGYIVSQIAMLVKTTFICHQIVLFVRAGKNLWSWK